MADREKGVANVACPTCGNELVLSDQLDGSVAAETCTSCYPAQAAPAPETAAAASAPRERGTKVKEESE